MKSFLQLFVLICCASLSSNAQSITFNSPPSTSQVCDSTLFEAYFTATSDTFTITIQAKVWNNNTLVSLPHPDCANGLSGNNPVIAGLNTVLSNTSCAADISAPLYNDTANSFTWTVILNANCSSSVEVFFYYYIKLDCSLFPDSGAFNQFNLIQNLTASSSTGNITTGITFPYFPPISSPVQVDANYGQQSTMIFPYENTGAAAAHINFSFQDLYVNNCTNAAYRVDSVHYDTGAVAPSVYTKELYAGFNNSIVVPAHKFLYVIQYITIINCPDSCLSAPKKSMFKW